MKARKAVSPVIATVLLILIAVAAAVIIWAWVSGAASQNPTTEEALQEKIVIDGVNVTKNTQSGESTTYTVKIYVTNLGKTKVTISSAYVLNGTTGSAVCSEPDLSEPIDVGKTDTVQISSCSLTSGNYYIAKVVTTNGVSATYSFTAP
jgi:flagellin-like protein